MEGSPSTYPVIALPGAGWSDRRWILLLFLLIMPLRCWQIWNTELTTRDSITYARYAWRLDREPWAKVIRSEAQHPGYGFLVHAVSRPIRAIFNLDLPLEMQLSGQIASALASILLLIPMFYLGKEMFDARVGFWSALLLQVLPTSGRLMPDGLSEPLFMLLVGTSLYCAFRALRGGGPVWFLLAGLGTGLAYLTRTEGLLMVPAMLVILLAQQATSRWKQAPRLILGKSLALLAGCALLAVPFMMFIGGISLKTSYQHITSKEGWVQPEEGQEAQAKPEMFASPLPFAVWWIGPDVTPRDRTGWAFWAVGSMVDKGFYHLLTLPTLFGAWWFRRRIAEVPGAWLMLLCTAFLLPLLWRLAQSAGYLGERHVMLIVMGGLCFAVAFIGALGGVLARGRHNLYGFAALLVLVAICVPKTAARLHGNRAGFRQAGVWLATHTQPNEEIFDPLAWTVYHSGRVFSDPGLLQPRSNICYVVMEKSSAEHAHLFYLLNLANDLISRGEVVYRKPLRRGAEILIYRVNRPDANHPTGASLDRWLATSLRR